MLGDSVRRRQPQKRAPAGGSRARGKGKRRGRSWKSFLLALLVALVVPAAIGYFVAVYVLFPPTEESEGGIPVPALIGQSASDAQRVLAGAGLGEIVPESMPHPDAPAGQVVAQSPLPGQQLRQNATVRVALSSGPPRALVPDVRGFSAERAESLLRRAGFQVAIVVQEDDAPAGRVLRTEPERGQESMLPSQVTLIVSEGPAAEVEPDTLGVGPGLAAPPDTLPAVRPLPRPRTFE